MMNFLKKIILEQEGFIYKYLLSPISLINNNKNYTNIFSYIIRNDIAYFAHYKYAIYFDNEDPSAVLQIDKWFNNNFFNKEDTIVLFRIYSSSLVQHTRFLEKNKYNFYAFKVLKYFDLSQSNIKYIFYPFNSFTNPVLIKYRNIKHIWITHGESDKLASVNPMIKMYDYMFVAGDVAVKRLKAYSIVNECDMKNNRVIKIGLPYVKKTQIKSSVKELKKILYAPTWEGVETEQQYSSLNNNWGIKVLEEFLTEYDVEISFQPHPSTGIKNKKYIKYVNNVINTFKNSKNFTLIIDKNSFIYNYIQCNNISDSNIEYSEFDFVFTDNSSIIANLIFYKMNYLVLLNNKNIDFKRAFLLSISSILTKRESLFNIINKELGMDKKLRYSQVIDDKYSTLKEIITLIEENNETNI